MAFDYVVGTKLDDRGEQFISDSWASIEGPNAGLSVVDGVAISIYDEGQIVGALKGWMSSGVGYVNELILDADYRGRGIGAEVLRRFEEHCRQHGHLRLGLRVELDTPAQKFYEREGWRQENLTSDWLGGHDYAQMRKDLRR